MTAKLGSLVLFSPRLAEMVRFYRAAGVPLEDERHEEDGASHFAAEVAGVHLAVYEAPDGDAPPFRAGGCTFPGLQVDDLLDALERVRTVGAPILSGPEDRPWGVRVVVADPDGRPVELWTSPG